MSPSRVRSSVSRACCCSTSRSAALDLGATPRQALHRVILPEIMPGIVTGDIMAFTMSVDDFVVSYFTAGTTNQPLSVVIYSMTRHRMTPKINAVSTLLFLFVLVLLVIINVSQSRDEKRREAARRGGCIMKLLKRTLALTLSAAMVLGLLSGCGSDASANVLNVYNWGEYIDTDLLDRFEQETGIKVIYNTFDSNENLYSRIQTTSYDVIIPSDYAISRFIDEDMLRPLNFDNIPNMKYIDEKYTHLDFDPEQKYSVPYTWGVVGIVYNTKYVDEADTGSWDLLWNPKYANRTAMFNNSRDALGIALMYLGCSLNTTDRDELRQAADLIIAGKPVYQGIWMDQILEKLPAEEIVAAPYYNGDAVTMIDENPDLAFYVLKEGTNLFVDAMCIPKNAKNVEGAEKFINFMCSTEAAMANWEYIGYSSPHTGVYEQLDEETRNDPLYFPDTSAYPTEAYTNLPRTFRSIIMICGSIS
ncbi:extracellular solute-binding protein [Butyricicoccus sp. AM29-23AC]|nr:extracellular solute-binding protein [Butyricicoccus sp. AM29-23AC]